MKELLLIGGIALGGIAVYSTVSVVKYEYEHKDLPSNDFIPKKREEPEEPVPVEIPGDVIYESNAFDINRGDQDAENTEVTEEPQEVKGTYSFELRGIMSIGESPLALISTKLNGRSSAVRGRTTSRSVVAASSDEIYNCKVGDTVGESQYTVQSIADGQALIKDDKGNEQTLTVSLTSDESMKRSEIAFKDDQARQKTFAKQNNSNNSKTSRAVNPPPPKAKTPEEEAKKREAEMKARAEKLKEEMKRLKELREQKNKSEKK